MMIRHGKGGSKTQTGKRFEQRAVAMLFSKTSRYTLTQNILLYQGNPVADIFIKHDLYSMLLKKLQVDWKTRICRKLLPDIAIIKHHHKTIYIVEIKYQQVPGSVDEKLQTCSFKLRQYKKLFLQTGLTVNYVYFLNKWYQDPKYRDVLDYIEECKCKYFFNPRDLLTHMGLPSR